MTRCDCYAFGTIFGPVLTLNFQEIGCSTLGKAEDVMPTLELVRFSMRDELVDNNSNDSGIGGAVDSSDNAEAHSGPQRPTRKRRPSRTGEDFVMQMEQTRTLGEIKDE